MIYHDFYASFPQICNQGTEGSRFFIFCLTFAVVLVVSLAQTVAFLFTALISVQLSSYSPGIRCFQVFQPQ